MAYIIWYELILLAKHEILLTQVFPRIKSSVNQGHGCSFQMQVLLDFFYIGKRMSQFNTVIWIN